jgi:hypothetical protein
MENRDVQRTTLKWFSECGLNVRNSYVIIIIIMMCASTVHDRTLAASHMAGRIPLDEWSVTEPHIINIIIYLLYKIIY